MGLDFIFMMTENDRTIANARDRLHEVLDAGFQHIGARIADHTIDIVIFFSDPMTAKIHDVDFIALTRLAILHDTPIACSPAAVDLFVSARLLTPRTQKTLGVA